jgi:hypothetical protein
MEPTLVVNPATDRVFADLARMMIEQGATSTIDLERQLRSMYPAATVHARELVGEPIVIWYVYRDGHWIDSRPGSSAIDSSPAIDTGEHDVRPPRGPSIDGGLDPS